MKHLLSLACALCCAFPPACGQLLWEIRHDTVQAPSFLFGTVHVRDKRVFNLPDSLRSKMEGCRAFAGELSYEEVNDMALLMHLFMPEDTTLQDLLAVQEYKLVKEEIELQMGELSDWAERIKPLFLSEMLVSSPVATEEVMEQHLDLFLMKMAEGKGLEVYGLETSEEQLDVINKIPLGLQARNLYSELANRQQAMDQRSLMTRLYLGGQIDSLYHLTSSSFHEDLEFALITRRNQLMAGRIASRIVKEPVFVAIGAAHLGGEQGVISLLREKGFVLRPVGACP